MSLCIHLDYEDFCSWLLDNSHQYWDATRSHLLHWVLNVHNWIYLCSNLNVNGIHPSHIQQFAHFWRSKFLDFTSPAWSVESIFKWSVDWQGGIIDFEKYPFESTPHWFPSIWIPRIVWFSDNPTFKIFQSSIVNPQNEKSMWINVLLVLNVSHKLSFALLFLKMKRSKRIETKINHTNSWVFI